MDPPNTPKPLNIKRLLAVIGYDTSSSFYMSMGLHLIEQNDHLPEIHGIVRICFNSTYNESIGQSFNFVTHVQDAVGRDVNLTDHPDKILYPFLAALNLSSYQALFRPTYESTLTNLLPPGFEDRADDSLTIAKLIEAWFKHANTTAEYPEGTFGAQFLKDVLHPMLDSVRSNRKVASAAPVPNTGLAPSPNIEEEPASAFTRASSNVATFTPITSAQVMTEPSDEDLDMMNHAIAPIRKQKRVKRNNTVADRSRSMFVADGFSRVGL